MYEPVLESQENPLDIAFHCDSVPRYWILVRFVQAKNAIVPIEVTLLPIVTLVRLVQPENVEE